MKILTILRNIIVPLFAFLTPLLSQSQAVITGVIPGSPFCPGASITVPYTTTGTFNQGNVFSAELSDAAGSFNTPVTIGSLTTISGGTINVVIPVLQAAGTQYRIRVTASNPSVTGTVNGDDLVVSTVSALFSEHFKTWIGNTGVWNNPANWSPCGLPNGASKCLIGANAIVTIPAGINVNTLRVQMSAGAKLIVAAGATLNNNGSAATGFQLTDEGTQLTNSGTIKFGNFAGIATTAIFMFSGSSIINQATGVIEINRTGLDGIGGSGIGTITNAGSIKIGNIATIGQAGINITGGMQMTNQAGGTIEINNITADGISVNTSTTNFINSGILKLGNAGPLKRSGISLFNSSNFTNSNAATIEINNITSTITNEGRGVALNSTSIFTNNGQIKIGNTTAIYRSCLFISSGQFNNQADAVLELNRTMLLDGVSGNGMGSINNAGNIIIGNLAKLSQCGINMNNGFQLNNLLNGTIQVNNVSVFPAISMAGTATLMNNAGSIKIGNLTSLSDGMVVSSGAKCTNQNNAVIQIDNAVGPTSSCLSIFGAGSAYTNSGNLKIGNLANFSRRGIDMFNGGLFTNTTAGVINILNTTVNNADFRAASLTGANTQFNNAGKLTIRLTAAPVLPEHGLNISDGSSFHGSAESVLELLLSE